MLSGSQFFAVGPNDVGGTGDLLEIVVPLGSYKCKFETNATLETNKTSRAVSTTTCVTSFWSISATLSSLFY